MFILYHQNMMGMATSLEKSTGQDKLAQALRDYCDFFAEKTNINIYLDKLSNDDSNFKQCSGFNFIIKKYKFISYYIK